MALNPNRSRARLYWPAVALPVVFLACGLPLIWSGNLSGTGAFDQLLFHQLDIRWYVRDWPNFDFRNATSATTPGYHLLLAAYAKFIDPSRQALQVISSLFTVGLVSLLGAACSRRAVRRWAREGGAAGGGSAEAGARRGSLIGSPLVMAFVCALPLVASQYVFFRGVWLAPDNIGWWLMLTVLVIALRPWTRWSAVLAGLALMGLVFVRQSHLWAAAAVWMAAWVSISAAGDDERAPSSMGGWIASLFKDVPKRLGPAAIALAATVPAFLIVAAFVKVWGGLVVPRWQSMYHGNSPAAPAFILSNLAIISCFFGAYLLPHLAAVWRRHRMIVLLAAAAGLVVALVPETTYSLEQGRFSGLWTIVRKTPVIAGRTSPVLVVLAPIGAAMLVAWLTTLRYRERWIFMAALAGFTAAQLASPQVWQRYNEPFLLMMVALWACSAASTMETALPAAVRKLLPVGRVIGPLGLTAVLALITAATIMKAQPIVPEESPQFVAPVE